MNSYSMSLGMLPSLLTFRLSAASLKSRMVSLFSAKGRMCSGPLVV